MYPVDILERSLLVCLRVSRKSNLGYVVVLERLKDLYLDAGEESCRFFVSNSYKGATLSFFSTVVYFVLEF